VPYLPELYRQLSQQAIDDPNFAIGPSYFMDRTLTETRLAQIWRRSIIPYLEEYYFEQEDAVAPWRWESARMRAVRMGEGS
jgi:5-methylcytosine-specific restriction protein B